MNGIGNTPLLKLSKLTGPQDAEVYVKYEGANPTGSMKDRMALAMIEGAERRGELSPGDTVLEYTGGSTGTSLAMVCARRGYRALLVTSDVFAREKLRSMQAFGAELELIPGDNGRITAALIDRLVERAAELARQPGVFPTDQFNNTDNRSAYRQMAREVIDQLGGLPDAFVMGVGTGACFSGNAEVFRSEDAAVRCVAIEPDQVRFLSGGSTGGTHRLEGIGAGFIPAIFRSDLMDEVQPVRDEDAMATARRLAREEGIFGGTTSGANVWTALRLARQLGPGHRIVTVICDSGLKYLNGDLYSEIP